MCEEECVAVAEWCEDECRFSMCPNMIHRVSRKEVQELGLTLVINARKKPPSPHIYRALMMVQVEPTSYQCTRTLTHTLTHSHVSMLKDVKASSLIHI